MIKQIITLFILTLKKKQLLMKVTLMMYLNQSLHYSYIKHTKVFRKKVQVGLLIQL